MGVRMNALSVGLAFNVVVLVPVLAGLLAAPRAMDRAFGPGDAPARRILGCVYAAILAASLALLGAQAAGLAGADVPALTLFAVQIAYKLLTIPAVGLANPVVATNLLVVLVHAGSIAAWIMV